MYIIERLLSILFPYSDEVAHVTTMPLEVLFNKITPHVIEDSACISLYSYHDPLVRALVYAAKFEGSKEAAYRIALLMNEALKEVLFEKLLFEGIDTPLLIPVPLGKVRMKTRGFNQAERIAHRLALLLPQLGTVTTGVLIRSRDTKKQSHIRSDGARAENVRKAFSIPHPELLYGKHVILIDDVVSTGSTLYECSKVIEGAGGRPVVAIAFAR